MNLSLLSSLLKEKQFVVVDLTDKYLVFLVDDVEKPQVPGFPAMALEYYKELSDARQAIEDAGIVAV